MKLALCSTSLLAVLVFSSTCYGLRIYLSDSSTSPAISNPTLDLQPDGTGSLYIWVSPDAGETVNGMGLSLRASDPGIVSVTNHEVFNPTNSNIAKPRWDGVSDGATSVGSLLFANSNAASVFGATGMDPDLFHVGGDPLAVVDGDLTAYLHSRIDVAALGIGQTDLFLQVGQALITVEGQGAAESVQFGAGEVPGISGGTVGATDSEPDGYIHVFGGFTGLIWDAPGDGNWNDPNWIGGDPGSVPDATTGVSVETNAVTVASDAYAQSLAVDNGGAVTVDAGSVLTIVDSVTVGNGMLDIAATGGVTAGGAVTLEDGSVYACELGEAGNGVFISTGDVSLLTGSTLVMQATGSLGAVGPAAMTIILADEGATMDGSFTNAPSPDAHLGHGVFLRSVEYTESTADAHVFQAAAGDANGDRQVDNGDLQEILGAGSFNNPGQWDWVHGDFNGNGSVANDDLQLILATSYFGAGPYAAAAPGMSDAGPVAAAEPRTVILLLTGSLVGMLLRRRKSTTRWA